MAQTVQSTHDLRLLFVSHWPATADSARWQCFARSSSNQPEEAVPTRLSPDDVNCPSCAASCDGAHPIADCFLQLNPASAQSSCRRPGFKQVWLTVFPVVKLKKVSQKSKSFTELNTMETPSNNFILVVSYS
jgi:hypothetical protein